MTRSEIIADLDALGHFLEHVYSENNTTHQNFSKELTERFQEIIASELYRNGWFTQENVCKALAGIREWLKLETLHLALIHQQSFLPSLVQTLCLA